MRERGGSRAGWIGEWGEGERNGQGWLDVEWDEGKMRGQSLIDGGLE